MSTMKAKGLENFRLIPGIVRGAVVFPFGNVEWTLLNEQTVQLAAADEVTLWRVADTCDGVQWADPPHETGDGWEAILQETR